MVFEDIPCVASSGSLPTTRRWRVKHYHVIPSKLAQNFLLATSHLNEGIGRKGSCVLIDRVQGNSQTDFYFRKEISCKYRDTTLNQDIALFVQLRYPMVADLRIACV